MEENKKRRVHLQVCSGTACFVMGGSDLLTVFEYLNPEEQDRVSLAAVPCFEHCRNWKDMRPPFITIDGKLYDHMTMDKMLTLLREIINS